MAQIQVFRGNQIGGCITVITCEKAGRTSRIMIDYGANLPGSEAADEYQYPWEEMPVDAVLFTHYHGDHAGRILEIPAHIPLYMGAAAREIMMNIERALANAKGEDAEAHQKLLEILEDDNRVRTFVKKKYGYQRVDEIPGFRIEPYMVDHSAYDAYMFLIEVENAEKEYGYDVILHTGDFRGHGRRGKAILPVIETYVLKKGRRKVDTLIVEGTMMGRLVEKVLTEQEMQRKATEIFREHRYAFLICSSTNLDSLAGFYQAAQEAAKPYQRYFYTYSEYCRVQLEAFTKLAGSYSEVYQFENVFRLNLEKMLKSEKWAQDKSQKEFMEERGFLALIKPEAFCEKYIDAFLQDYEAGCIKEKPVIIYSMWDGYVKEGNKAANRAWIEFLRKQQAKGVEIIPLHTSGHATAQMLTDVINAVNPREEIVPIHTEFAEKFQELKISEELKQKIRK